MLFHQGCQVGAALDGLCKVFLALDFQCKYIASSLYGDFTCCALITRCSGNCYSAWCDSCDFAILVYGSNLIIRSAPSNGFVRSVIWRYYSGKRQCLALDKCGNLLVQSNLFYSNRSNVGEAEVITLVPTATIDIKFAVSVTHNTDSCCAIGDGEVYACLHECPVVFR